MAGEQARLAVLSHIEQAWIHYRHIESMRSQYVGLVFSLFVAVPGIAAALVASGDVKIAESAPLLAVAAWSLTGFLLFTWFVLASVRVWGVVLLHHQSFVLDATASLVAGVDVSSPIWVERVRATAAEPRGGARGIGAHLAVERVLLALLGLSYLGLLALDTRLWLLTDVVGRVAVSVNVIAVIVGPVVGLWTPKRSAPAADRRTSALLSVGDRVVLPWGPGSTLAGTIVELRGLPGRRQALVAVTDRRPGEVGARSEVSVPEAVLRRDGGAAASPG